MVSPARPASVSTCEPAAVAADPFTVFFEENAASVAYSTATAQERPSKPESAQETKTESKPEPKPETGKVAEPSGVIYGVQVLATSRKMKASDAFFKGYTPLEVRSGKLYKYILVAGDDLSAVRKKKKELDKKFPGCFVVSKDGETVTRIP